MGIVKVASAIGFGVGIVLIAVGVLIVGTSDGDAEQGAAFWFLLGLGVTIVSGIVAMASRLRD